jgi:hypothetical protein
MAIFRCNHCGLLQEQPDSLAGQSLACPRCANSFPVYPTLFFIEKLLDKYLAVRSQVSLLSGNAGPAAVAAAPNEPEPLDDIDLGSTDRLASEVQHGPIYAWFHKRQIKVEANLRSVDTTGFFDEVAEAIGANLRVLREVVERIRWSQQKGYASTTITLARMTPEDAAAISTFCQQLYDFSFAAKCFHNRQEQNVRLVLQTAPAVREFFNGEWLEWHALMSSLRYTKERGKRFSCARGLHITLPNDEVYELDVFMLIDGHIPVCIECKTGEFRQNIERYLNLKKRLGIDGRNFVMCVAGLDEDNAKAFSATYNLAFANERSLTDHLGSLF